MSNEVMTAQQAYHADYATLPRCPFGLTGWAMHRASHMSDALTEVGADGSAHDYYHAVSRGISACPVCQEDEPCAPS